MEEYKTPNYVTKPEDETWGDHVGPLKLNQRHKFLVHLAALGHSNKEICEKTGFTASWVSTLMSNTDIVKAIEAERTQLFAMDPDQALRLGIPNTVNMILDTVGNDQVPLKLRLETGWQLLDRTHGKAKQHVEVGGSMIKDLFKQLDSMKEVPSITIDPKPVVEDAQIVEASPTQKPEIDPRDQELEEWLKRNHLEK